MENNPKEKFYNKMWFMWLTLVIFAPIGIFLMYKNKKFSPKARGVITGVFGLWFLLVAIGVNNNPSSTSDNKTDSSKPATVATAPKKEEVKKEEPKPQSMKELLGKDLSELDVKEEGKELTINFKIKDNLTSNIIVEGALFDVKKVLKDVKSNDEFKKFELVRFNAMGDFTDKYGNSSKQVALSLTFNQSEIQKVVDFDKITLEQFVALQGTYRTGVHSGLKKDLKPETIKLLYPN